MANYHYEAVRRDGTDISGGIALYGDNEIANWVEDRFRARWRKLVIVQVANGRQVGAIGQNEHTGRRYWWAGSNEGGG